jgi:hypothetical protein
VKVWRVLLATTLVLLTQWLIRPVIVQAGVIPVAPGQSINAAIEQASEGDTVLVQPGSYQEAIRLKGGVVLRGQGGAALTRLIGLPDEAVVTAVGFGQRTLDGFTIDGGYLARAGVEVDLYDDGAMAIVNCRILESYGPGIEAYLLGAFSHLALARNVLAGNAGPGLWADAEMGTVLAIENEIVENGSGGCSAYAADGGWVELVGNRIEANQAEEGGGIHALAVWGGRIDIAGNRLGGNEARHGGGIDAVVVAASLAVVNNDVHQNGADEHGGISVDARYGSYLECAQNTAAENDAPDLGVWIDVTSDSVAQIANNLFWGNRLLDYAGPASHHSVIGTGNNGGEGNVYANPRFYDPEAGDYRLTIHSPCVDQGDNNSIPPQVSTDAAGRPRVRGSAVDPGAYEFASARELVADLNAEMDEMAEIRMISNRTLRNLRTRLTLADYYLRSGADLWALYYLGNYISMVRVQSGLSIHPDAATRLETAAREIYDQVERWGG